MILVGIHVQALDFFKAEIMKFCYPQNPFGHNIRVVANKTRYTSIRRQHVACIDIFRLLSERPTVRRAV